MILTQSDIDEFVEAYRNYCNFEDIGSNETWSNNDVLAWLTEHPQVVIAAGFQEFVAGGESESFSGPVPTVRRHRPLLSVWQQAV
jgi:hypothetical protein